MTSRKPAFSRNLLQVLNKKKPEKPTLFEFLIDPKIKAALAGFEPDHTNIESIAKFNINAFSAAGYEYASVIGSDFHFNRNKPENVVSYSINDGGLIKDYETFEKYIWNNPDSYDYSILKVSEKFMPDDFKLMVYGRDGILENTIGIVGYETLCFMLEDEPALAKLVFDNVGSRLLRYYENCLNYSSVGLIMSNDDWGFFSSTLLSHDQLKTYVYPWHKKIVELGHKHNVPVVLHSCGNFTGIYEDIYNPALLGFDAKHSNEDKILPVEQAYKNYHKNVAIVGGIDLDFIIRSPLDEITKRCSAMLEQSAQDGAYALGSGNSIANYVPAENYFALLKAAVPDFKL